MVNDPMKRDRSTLITVGLGGLFAAAAATTIALSSVGYESPTASVIAVLTGVACIVSLKRRASKRASLPRTQPLEQNATDDSQSAAIFSWLWLPWLLTKRAVELAVMAACLFAVPNDRLEHVIAVAAAAVWLAVRHQTIVGEMVSRSRLQPDLQIARTVLARVDRSLPLLDEATLDEDFRQIQDHVGIGNVAVLSPKYERLRQPLTVRRLRAELEQVWFDNLIGFQHNTAYMITEGVCSWCRIAVVIGATLTLH